MKWCFLYCLYEMTKLLQKILNNQQENLRDNQERIKNMQIGVDNTHEAERDKHVMEMDKPVEKPVQQKPHDTGVQAIVFIGS